MENRIIDISVAVNSDLVTWPGSVGYHENAILKIGGDSVANLTQVEMDVHTGTHVDAPLHFLENGHTMATMPLDKLVGRCYVVDCKDATVLSVEVMGEVPLDAKKVLFKTSNSDSWKNPSHAFIETFVGLNKEAAQVLASRKMDLVGVDYLSIQGYREHPDTHRYLLKENVVLLEGIDLREVNQGWYTLYCLPVKLENIEAAPCRAILIEE